MKLAINYSPQAEEAVDAGQIDIDLFKCPDDDELIARAQRIKPAYVHSGLNAGAREFSPDWKKLEELKNATATRFINIHLTATNKDYPDIPVTSQESAHQERILEKALKDMRELISRFGAENVILENDPYHAEARASLYILRPPTEPKMIAEVIRQTGCGLLLDIDHARVSSYYMGISLEDYVAQLPTDRLMELHMTGTKLNKEGWLESHYEMQDEDWPIFDWALDKIRTGAWARPAVYAFEYGGIGEKFDWRTDKAAIAEQIPLFRKRINALRMA